jgi:hypothetical protein
VDVAHYTRRFRSAVQHEAGQGQKLLCQFVLSLFRLVLRALKAGSADFADLNEPVFKLDEADVMLCYSCI